MHVTLAAVLLVLVRTVLGADSNPDENQGINDTNLFEGDIILTPGQKWRAEHELDVDSSRRKRGSSRRRLWPGGIIVYAIQSTLARNSRASAAIKAGMDEWTSKTCIRFKARTNERSYVYFRSGAGCSSYLGRIGKAQPITLARRCWTRGVVAHEIGHALGFYHEQSRPDRDNYITIVMANIRRNRRSNFHKYPRSRIDSLGTPYDYGSVMHYGSKAFSRNGRPTIRVKKTGATIGQRKGLSATDARQGNLLYNGLCPVVPTSPPSGCVNYTNLTDFDREKDYRDPQGVGKNDSSLTKAWYRFTGAAGKQMATKVVPKNHCSTRATGWLNGEHPTVAQGIVRHKVCFHWKNQRGRRSYDDPCRWSVDIRVLNCSSFFVYELLPTLSCCSLRYCGDDLIGRGHFLFHV